MNDVNREASRVAVLTGGAGAIGAAAAGELARQGAAVVLVDSDARRLDEVVATVRGARASVLGVAADLTDPAAVDGALDRAIAHFGRIDILVNTLGDHLGLSGEFEHTDAEQWDRLYRVNLLHVMQACRYVVPGMRGRGWGRIVNFSSVEGMRAMPSSPPYAAFNAAVDAFTKSLAVEVARHGIRVNSIAVDKVRAHQTGFYRQFDDQPDIVAAAIPAGRLGEPSDIAPIVALLCSDAAGWLVGHALVADGGTLAAGGWYRDRTGWTNTPGVRRPVVTDDPSH